MKKSDQVWSFEDRLFKLNRSTLTGSTSSEFVWRYEQILAQSEVVPIGHHSRCVFLLHKNSFQRQLKMLRTEHGLKTPKSFFDGEPIKSGLLKSVLQSEMFSWKEKITLFRINVCGRSVSCIDNKTFFDHAFGLSRAIFLSCQIHQHEIKIRQFRSVRLNPRFLTKIGSLNRFGDVDLLFTQLLGHYLHTFKTLRSTQSKKLKKYTDGGIDEIELIKRIKFSMACKFSWEAGQDKPVGDGDFLLFPGSFIEPHWESRHSRLRFYFTILQSKSICFPVSDGFVEETLKRHYEKLCPDEVIDTVPSEYLKVCEEIGLEFGKVISQFYQPYHTTEPPSTATNESPRKKNGHSYGCKGELQEKGILRDHRTLELPRVEPLVVGLFGPPGSGKTTSIPTIVNQLTESMGRSSVPEEDNVYYHSPFTQFWDGYRNQPIVVMDDFGQDIINGEDYKQFDLLVSSAEYVLPMASLEEKGRRFNSAVIILTSNLKFGQQIFLAQGSPVLQMASVWRRIALPYLILKAESPTGQSTTFRNRRAERAEEFEGLLDSIHLGEKDPNQTPAVRLVQKIIPDYTQLERMWRTYFSDESSGSLQNGGRSGPAHTLQPFNTSLMVEEICRAFTKRMEDRFHSRGIWYQNIAQGEIVREGLTVEVVAPHTQNAICRDLLFPSEPPIVRGSCRVIAIKEPLKARVITAGSAFSRVLKPFQVALHQGLRTFPEFSLVGESEEPSALSEYEASLQQFERIENALRGVSNRYPSRSFLSGDYESATDGFFMSVTEVLLESILKSISHEPTKRWARWEIGSKELIYPDGLRGTQKRGQLMGSILSFPLLCLANKALCLWCGMEPNSFLINGDDLVSMATPQQKALWFERGSSVGLKPTVGKTYVDPDFCTFNSQLFYRQSLYSLPDPELELDDEISPEGDLLHTGKLTLFCRGGGTVGETFRDAQKLYREIPDGVIESLFRQLNIASLRPLVSSLRVSYRWGGLSQKFVGSFNEDLAIKVYLCKLYKKVLSHETTIPNSPFTIISSPLCIDSSLTPVGANHWKTGYGSLQHVVNQIRSLNGYSVEEEEEFSDLSHAEFSRTWPRVAKIPGARRILKLPLFRLPPLDRVIRSYTMVRREVSHEYKKCIQSKFFQDLQDGTFDSDNSNHWYYPPQDLENPEPRIISEPFCPEPNFCFSSDTQTLTYEEKFSYDETRLAWLRVSEFYSDSDGW